MTVIQTFGPRQTVVDGLTRFAYFAEAVGVDGRLYNVVGYGRPTPFVEEQQARREQAGRLLEYRMRQAGVWHD